MKKFPHRGEGIFLPCARAGSLSRNRFANCEGLKTFSPKSLSLDQNIKRYCLQNQIKATGFLHYRMEALRW